MDSDRYDLLAHHLDVVNRRINRHLDNRDRHLFMVSCQYRAQLKAQLADLAAFAAPELEAA